VSQDKKRNDENDDAIYDGKGGNQNGEDIRSRKEEIKSRNE